MTLAVLVLLVLSMLCVGVYVARGAWLEALLLTVCLGRLVVVLLAPAARLAPVCAGLALSACGLLVARWWARTQPGLVLLCALCALGGTLLFVFR